MHSIRVKITAITIAAILTSILAVFFASKSTIQADRDRSSVEIMNLIGQNTQEALEKHLESIKQSVEMAANIAGDALDSVMLVECGVTGATSRTPEQDQALDAYLADYSERVQGAFASVAAHTHGCISYYYCICPEVSQNEHGFFYSRVGKTGFYEREPLDARQLDPGDTEHNAWYYTPIQQGRPSWIGPYRARLLGELWTYSYIVPIYKAGVLIGLLGMDIPFEAIVEQVSAIRFYETGYACLFDANGRMLYHPTLQFDALNEKLDQTLIDRVLGQESNGNELIRYTSDGQQRQMSFFTLSNGMKLVVVAPVEEIVASRTRLLRVVLITTAVIIVFFAILVLFVMDIITRPLKRLTAASQRLADGDYDVELSYRSRDEVGKLTDAFMRMRDQQKCSFDDLNRQIYTDGLTGLPNMRYFFKLAEDERRDMHENGRRPVILFFNLIGMKQYNRHHGFDEGDQLIRDFANLLRRRYARHSVSRFSQDHFAVLTDEDGLEEGIEAVFREAKTANGGKPLPVRVGIYQDSMGDVSITVACDRAKYASDQSRGSYVSTYCYFDRAMLKRAETFHYIINNLDRALSEGWIKVNYQAIIRASSGKVCDEEALSRWYDPQRGRLSPAEFIPALEETKLIYKLDLYVVEQVLEKMQRQAEAGLYVVPQSVNLSRMDFDSCDIVEEIRSRVDAAGIDRAKLTIEVTESVVGKDFDFMKTQVERFHALGFQVWMDDFGSGYSSLDVLQSIRFDLIKFDMRFMENFDRGDEAKIILTELTRMAIGLGVETVCEGVERRDQYEFLREIGCTKIQGYYFGKPLSFDEMLSRHESGGDMGLENPAESEYHAAIGRINLYDMGVLSVGDDDSLNRYFDTLPMSIIEINDARFRYVRCNKSYRDFLQRTFGIRFNTDWVDSAGMRENGPVSVFLKAIMRCNRDGNRVFIDERLSAETTVHTLVRHIAANPVTGTMAIAVAVLAVVKDDDNLKSNHVQIAK